MEVSGQVHFTAALASGYENPVPSGSEARWDPEQIWTLWRREKIHIIVRARNWTAVFQPVAQYRFRAESITKYTLTKNKHSLINNTEGYGVETH
jgi:hypothetical protein